MVMETSVQMMKMLDAGVIWKMVCSHQCVKVLSCPKVDIHTGRQYHVKWILMQIVMAWNVGTRVVPIILEKFVTGVVCTLVNSRFVVMVEKVIFIITPIVTMHSTTVTFRDINASLSQ